VRLREGGRVSRIPVRDQPLEERWSSALCDLAGGDVEIRVRERLGEAAGFSSPQRASMRESDRPVAANP